MSNNEMEDVKKECLTGTKWLRLVFMLIFAVVSYFVLCFIWVVAFFQFIYHLITGKTCGPLDKFSTNLSQYIAGISDYLCFQSEIKPFPFNEWPLDKAKTSKLKPKKAKKAEDAA